MRKLMLVLLLALIYISGYSAIVLTVESTVVEEGGVLPIKVQLMDESGEPIKGDLFAEASLGGFEELDLVFDGIEVDGEATVHYVAPYTEGEVRITFTSGEDTKELKLYVYKEEVKGNAVRAKVEDFAGSAAYKKADSEIWQPITVGVEVGEGDSILTMDNSYVVVVFPNNSKTRVLENTQLKIERLVKTEKGYVVELKQLKGKTYNSVKKLLKSGEKFVVKTDSVTAGVRGTKFAVVFKDGKPTVATFEGTVFAYFNDGRVFPVTAGNQISPDMDRPGPSEFEEGDFTKAPEEEAGKEAEGEKAVGGEKAPPAPPFQGIPSVYMGTSSKGGKNYLVYSISYAFNIGSLWMDLGLMAYNTELGGELYYGIPSDNPSTNLLDIVSINGIGLTLDDSFIKYQYMPLYDLGMAFTMRGYTVPNAHALDLKLSREGFAIYAHIPYELTKLSSFSFSPSDSIWFGQLEFPVFGMEGFLAAIYDTKASTPAEDQLAVQTAGMVGVKKNIGFGNIGVEGSVEVAKDDAMAFGAFGGYFGRFGVFGFTAGVYGALNGFHPFLFGRNYYQSKLDEEAPGIYKDGRHEFGYLIGAELSWDLIKGRLHLYGSFGGSPVLSGDLRGVIPQLGVGFNGLYITGHLYDETPGDGVFNKGGDADVWLKLSYPILGENLTAGFLFKWTPETGEWNKYILIGADIWR